MIFIIKIQVKPMKKQATNKLINEMKQMLGNKKNLTVESLVFNEAEEDYGFDEEDFGDDVPSEEPTQNTDIEAQVKPVIDQIRKMSLQGIAQLSEYPECETYNVLKKIWQMVDKAIETQNKPVKE